MSLDLIKKETLERAVEAMVRFEVRNIVKEVFQNLDEAESDGHALDRLKERILDVNEVEVGFEVSNTVGDYEKIGTYKIEQSVKDEILSQFKKVESTNFPTMKEYGVHIHSFYIDPNKIDFYGGYDVNFAKNKKLLIVDDNSSSNGTEIYIIVRGNMMYTIYFAKRYIQQTPEKLRVDTIVKNIDNFSNKPKSKPGKGRKKVSLNLPVVKIQGKDFYLDEENEKIIYTKNIKKTLSLDNLPEEEYEEILSQINQ